MHRTKSTARRSHMVAVSSSSSEDDMSLSADHEEALTLTRNVAQCRGGVPLQRNQFTRKY